MDRHLRLGVAVLVLSVVCAAESGAAHIDAELKALLANKNDDQAIPVLMVFPEQPDLEDLEVMLDGATPNKRRRSAIAALKRQVRKAQSDAWEILEDPDRSGDLIYADMLYLSNAIAFSGDREVVLAVAEAGEGDKAAGEAILFYDKGYELLGDRLQVADDGLKSASEDTAWSLKYVNAPDVWRELGYTGEGIVVGHIDTGPDRIPPRSPPPPLDQQW